MELAILRQSEPGFGDVFPPDPRDFGEGCLSLVVRHAREGVVTQSSVDESLRQRP